MSSVKIAIVQEEPVLFDIEKGIAKAIQIIDKAANKGVKLIVFGETWLSGYPAFLDYCPEIGLWDSKPMKKVFARMYENSVEVGSKTTELLCDQAKKHNMVIVMGINEKAKKPFGTIYNSIITINQKGEIANHHRKLMPTFTEKLVYGIGDGNGLKGIETTFGTLGSLICWEHWMPLTRQAMHIEGEIIHIACWPSVHEKHQLASRQYAFEGRCFIVAVGQMLHNSQLPKELKFPETHDKNTWILNGGSAVIGPDANYLLEPQFNKNETIIFEIEDLERAVEEKMTLDVGGHYNRSDVFDFEIKTQKRLN